MAKVEVRRMGAYWETGPDGNLAGPGGRRAVQGPWSFAVEELVDHYRREWGEAIHSVYVRGSVARGLALAGIADIDTFGVLEPGADGEVDPERLHGWSETADSAIRAKFPFATGVEVDLVPYSDALDRTNVYAFTIKAEAICVHGEDLSTRLTPFAPSPEIAFQTRWFRRHLDTFAAEYPEEPAAQKPGFVAWLMKRFLRLGMELVMLEEGRYTRDLYLCYESFARHYPAQAAEMRLALEAALNPVADPETETFALGFGAWLAAEAERKLAAWAL